MRQPFFLGAQHSHTLFLYRKCWRKASFAGKEKGKEEGGKQGVSFQYVSNIFEAINKPTTGTLSPRKTGQSSRKTQAKLCPYMGAILLPATVPRSPACRCCCCCCQLCKRKMTNELVIDNNRKQKVSVAAKFPLTIAKKQWKSRGRAKKRSRERGDCERRVGGGKSKSIWRCDVVEVVDRCACTCSTCANDAGCVFSVCVSVSCVCATSVCVCVCDSMECCLVTGMRKVWHFRQ